jgi:hypothetical protein
MPTPFDLLSEKLDDQSDPDDQLRLQLGQDQGANLAGGPDAQPNGMTPPSQGGVGGPPAGMGGSPQPMAPSPNVPGPLAALAKKTPGKPRIKLKTPQAKKKTKPRIKLKASAYAPT